MKISAAMHGYTANQVKPLLDMQLEWTFLPQSVPAYAATEMFAKLRATHPGYTYKEAALDPTNPRNRTTGWEAKLVQEFRNNPRVNEIVAERNTPSGRVIYLARPIEINDQACLECHGFPAAAPRTMVQLYGDSNGFGWKLDEIVGARIVSVPMSKPMAKAKSVLYTFMTLSAGIFLLMAVVLNIMLSREQARISNV